MKCHCFADLFHSIRNRANIWIGQNGLSFIQLLPNRNSYGVQRHASSKLHKAFWWVHRTSFTSNAWLLPHGAQNKQWRSYWLRPISVWRASVYCHLLGFCWNRASAEGVTNKINAQSLFKIALNIANPEISTNISVLLAFIALFIRRISEKSVRAKKWDEKQLYLYDRQPNNNTQKQN